MITESSAGDCDEKGATECKQPETLIVAASTKKTWRFWLVFMALSLISFVCSIDSTIVVTALPTITHDIGGEEHYVWIAGAFTLGSTVPQPLFAQISNIFGRRNPFIIAIILFAIGSGLAGGASGPAMLIIGRTIQGIGAGGTYVLLDVICCDMVPLRERGQYLGLMLSAAAIGTTIGPLIGGAFAESNWRWIFYLNLPFSGVALAFVLAFLNILAYKRNPDWPHALRRVDWLGAAVFIPSFTALLIGLTLGGVQYAWNSWQIILPLALGAAGWTLFHCLQANPRLCPEPSIPPHLFTNRTSAGGFLLTALTSVLLQAAGYFLPVYFQAVRGASPFQAGVDLLPTTMAVVPFGIAGGVFLSRFGRYRPLHLSAAVLLAVGAGLLSTLSAASSAGQWIGYQVVFAGGGGLAAATTLPAILAALPEADVATASGVFSCLRSFGYVWGVALAAAVFNGQVDMLTPAHVAEIAVQVQLTGGRAYSFASRGSVQSLPPAVQTQVVEVYVGALAWVWRAMIVVAGVAGACVLVERHVELRKDLRTDYGMEEKQKADRAGEVEAARNGEREVDSPHGVGDEMGTQQQA